MEIKIELMMRAWEKELERISEEKYSAPTSGSYYRKRIKAHEWTIRNYPKFKNYKGKEYPLAALKFDKKLLAIAESAKR